MNHILEKTRNGYHCQICSWDWASKPRSECPGVTRYNWGSQPDYLKTESQLYACNLKPKKGVSRSACILLKRHGEIDLYNTKDCEVKDPLLPKIYAWDGRSELKTAGELKKINLVPSEGIEPRGVAWVWDDEIACGGKWIPLYHPDDCGWKAKDSYVTKTALKQKYLLSDSWIKRLGQANKLIDNPHGRNVAPIQLFSRQRVEQLLADNAEEYAKWLDKRDKYLAIFEANKEKIFQRRNLVRDQTAKCLRCASGCGTPQGFLCAIYPSGIQNMPCPDWFERDNSGK